jgi:transmembrane sensor
MQKEYFEPEDLLTDESFLAWYFQSPRQPNSVWERWIKEAPGREELARQAIALLDSTVIGEKALSAGQLEQAETALMERAGEAPQTERAAAAVVHLSGYRNWRWIAAACIFVLLAGSLVTMRILSVGEQLVMTQFGQLTIQQLPDGSEVTVNANSRIRYANNWHTGGNREVWMEGEAFFQIRKTLDHRRFVVHTDRFDVVVTGTQFNVVSRPGRANVLLHEGSVTLQAKDGSELKMTSGDFVQWDEKGLNKRVAQRDSVLAWKDRKLFFDKTPLRDVATIIEDQYGVKVHLADPSLGDSTITGIMRNNDLNTLLKALQATTDFDVTNIDGTIEIKAPAH